MKNDIKNRFVAYGRDNENIRSIFYRKSMTDDEFVDLYIVPREVIIGKLEEDLGKLFEDIFLINRIKSSFQVEKDRQNYTILEAFRASGVKISQSIIAEDLLGDFLGQAPSDFEFIYNKGDMPSLMVNEAFTYDLPKEYEFRATVDSFFAKAVETSLFLRQKNAIGALMTMDKLRQELIKMINFYIIDKYNGLRDMGKNGRDISHSLSQDLREDFELTFPTNELLDIYTCLFKACGLFRKIGMKEANDLSYEYNREADVKALKLLRKNYKKLESILR
ncbi:MAG: aminoglycoside 6-adenylyltransferase [Anaerococcus sp.]|nr:aminoglycoside 6-adenylyltransferase [Anaerococcus sp.]